jgi:hypothetical protein
VLVYVLGVLLFGQTRIIKDWVHLIPTSIFALILLCAGLQRATVPIPAQWSKRLGLLAFAIVTVPYIVLPAIFWEVDTRSIWTRPCPWTIETSGCASLPTDLAEAVHYVRNTIEPGRPIFVGNTRNDWLWGNAIIFYFLADRPSATRYEQLEAGISTTASAQTEMVSDIERRGVTHVVLYSGFDNRIPPYRIGSTILDDFIQSHFQPAATFGEYSIWERIP